MPNYHNGLVKETTPIFTINEQTHHKGMPTQIVTETDKKIQMVFQENMTAPASTQLSEQRRIMTAPYGAVISGPIGSGGLRGPATRQLERGDDSATASDASVAISPTNNGNSLDLKNRSKISSNLNRQFAHGPSASGGLDHFPVAPPSNFRETDLFKATNIY